MLPEPTNIIEYNARYFDAQRISGYGLETTMHMPCPFCVEPDFLVYRILEVQEAMARGAVCKRCGRGCRAIFTHPNEGHLKFEIVQTVGPDAPEWLEPKMRRVS